MDEFEHRLMETYYVKIEGAEKLMLEISDYLNNWKSITIAGLEKRRIQCKDGRNKTNEIILFHGEKLSKREIGKLEKLVLKFENLLVQVNEKLEYRLNKEKTVLDKSFNFELDYQSNKKKIVIEKSFIDYLDVTNPEKLAKKLKENLLGCKTIEYAALITALTKTNSIKTYPSAKAIHTAMTEYFGNIGNYQGFSSYLNINTDKHNNLKKSGKIEKLIDIINQFK